MTADSKKESLAERDHQAMRDALRPLLVPSDPQDAMTAYYVLEYDERRTRLALHHGPSGQVDGFVAICQTGRDLFIPLVLVRGPRAAVREMLTQELYPRRPYSVITLPELRGAVVGQLSLEWERTNSVLALDPAAFRPVVNVMVQPGTGAHRFEIRVQGDVVSAAGVNWVTSHYADMYVYTQSDYQGRGWGRAVGARCVASILEARLLPLYTVAEGNVRSQRLAQALGFRDQGVIEFECRGRLCE